MLINILIKRLFFILSVIAFVGITRGPLYPAEMFDISYLLTEGGYRLELDSANLFKGVKITVNSTASIRYEVNQRITQPLENRDKPGVFLDNNFVMRGLRGSNKTGNFRIPSSNVSVRMDDVLYVSDANGSADTFTLFFGIDRIQEVAPGIYSGRIAFTLKPIGSSLAPVTKILEAQVTVRVNDSGKPLVEITTPTGLKNILIDPQKQDAKRARVIVKINADFNNPFRIMQFLMRPLESEDGASFPRQAFEFMTRGVTKGSAKTEVTPVTDAPQEVYRSGPGGKADPSFEIEYFVDESVAQKAGKYRSRMQYILEQDGVQTRLDNLDVEIGVNRIFELVIQPQDQRYSIVFTDLKPTQAPRQSEVAIEIKSNIGKPYHVSQDISMDLTNKEGKTIPSSYFSLRTERMDSKGSPKFANKEEVKKGHTVLFVSDALGSADKFKIIYELACPKDAPAGDYSAGATFSLLEM